VGSSKFTSLKSLKRFPQQTVRGTSRLARSSNAISIDDFFTRFRSPSTFCGLAASGEPLDAFDDFGTLTAFTAEKHTRITDTLIITECCFSHKSYPTNHTHPFDGPLSGTTRVSQYQKGKTSLDFIEARDSEWQWHQLGHMQVCT